MFVKSTWEGYDPDLVYFVNLDNANQLIVTPYGVGAYTIMAHQDTGYHLYVSPFRSTEADAIVDFDEITDSL